MVMCPHCHNAVESQADTCPTCQTTLRWEPHCSTCNNVLERQAACGSVSYFCPSCNLLVSRRTVVWLALPETRS